MYSEIWVILHSPQWLRNIITKNIKPYKTLVLLLHYINENKGTLCSLGLLAEHLQSIVPFEAVFRQKENFELLLNYFEMLYPAFFFQMSFYINSFWRVCNLGDSLPLSRPSKIFWVNSKVLVSALG